MKKYTTISSKKNMLNILSLSSWSFVFGISTIIFGYLGLRLDGILNTEPMFFIGFIFLSIFLCIMRLYNRMKIEIKKL